MDPTNAQERYTRYLNRALFSGTDVYIRGKYEAHQKLQPFGVNTVFSRLDEDNFKRKLF